MSAAKLAKSVNVCSSDCWEFGSSCLQHFQQISIKDYKVCLHAFSAMHIIFEQADVSIIMSGCSQEKLGHIAVALQVSHNLRCNSTNT